MNLHVYSPTSSRPTVCVTGAGAGVNYAWEQYKLEARKMLENAARRPYGWQSPASSAPWNDGRRSFSTKETVQQKYTPNEQVYKPYKAVGDACVCSPAVHLGCRFN